MCTRIVLTLFSLVCLQRNEQFEHHCYEMTFSMHCLCQQSNIWFFEKSLLVSVLIFNSSRTFFQMQTVTFRVLTLTDATLYSPIIIHLFHSLLSKTVECSIVITHSYCCMKCNVLLYL